MSVSDAARPVPLPQRRDRDSALDGPGSTAAPVWTPTPEAVQRSSLTAFGRWLSDHRGLAFDDHESLWHWSTTEPSQFGPWSNGTGSIGSGL